MKQKLLLSLALTLGLASNTRALDQVGGVYQIGSAQDLVDFAALVNGGTTGANAVLTANIDLDGTTWTPIGNASKMYTGTFDGQGYAITNFEYTSTGNGGLFGKVGSTSVSATIKNFSISGKLNVTSNKYAGVIAQALKSTISNVHSSLTINATGGDHVGGVVGSTENTEKVTGTTIDGCTYNGTMTVSGAGNFAGIVGYVSVDIITNCANYGSITYSTANCAAGGIIGYINNASVSVQNCLNTGSISYDGTGSPSYGGAIIGRHRQAATNVTNNYWLAGSARQSSGTTVLTTPAATSVSDEQLASGEVCYLLNGDQSDLAFYQTLGTDKVPTLDASRGTVYLAGRTHCDGTAYTGVSGYSNTANVQDEHDNVDGFCSYCGAFIEDGLTPNADGNYEISNATQLQWFATKVNSGDMTVNAILTFDIDMSTLTSWTAIGDWGSTPNGSACFKGHFNGQGFAIKNFNFTASHNYYGLFGVISSGALIENFSVNGSINNSSNRYVAGAVAYARDANPTIRNIRSYVNITTTYEGGRHGGILGGSLDGTVKIDNCSYFGEIKVPSGGNYGGIVGYVNNSTSAFLDVTDCLFAGFIRYTDGVTSGSGACGGIVGYNNAGYATIKNCLSLGDITTDVRGLIFGQLNGNNSKVYNCYYQGDYANDPTSTGTASPMEATPVSDERLASGEIAFLLNESVSGGTEWFQTLPDDSYPTPFDMGHAPVYMNGHQHCNGDTYAGASYSNEDLGTITDPHDFVDGFCSYCNTIKEKYITPIDGYYMIGTPAQLKWFAAFVNAGNPSANAKLANITPLDLTGVAVEPIGNSSAAYTGTFDGQGKSITGFSATSTGNGGLFGNINNATIKDFSISGSLTVNSGTGSGVIGWATNSTISGIHSTLNIAVSNNDVHHVGGVAGSAQGNNTISGCSFAGSVTVTGTSVDNFAGIVAYIKAGDNVTNCANYGEITFADTNCRAGGVVGYNNSTASIKNCLNTGTVTCSGGTPAYGGAIVGRQVSTVNTARISNNYWLETSASKVSGGNALSTSAESVTATQLASGEVAYKLGSAWYQTLGTDADATPVLDSNSEKVLYVGAAGYSTFHDPDNDWALSSYKDDAKAFIGMLTAGGSALHLTEISDIPAKTAVVISGTYYNKVSTTATANTTGNVLKGSNGSVTGDGSTIFALADGSNGVGFYPVGSDITIPAGKAYLVDTTGGVDTTDGSVKGFTFVFDDDATGIEMVNGQWSMVNDQPIYNVAGQRLSRAQKGINIVGGKKIVIGK